MSNLIINASIALMGLFVIQFGAYILIIRKFGVPIIEALKASLWSVFLVGVLAATLIIFAGEGSERFTGFRGATIAIAIAFAYGLMSKFIQQPFDRYLVDSELDPGIYKLGSGATLLISIPLLSPFIVILLILLPKHWLTGAGRKQLVTSSNSDYNGRHNVTSVYATPRGLISSCIPVTIFAFLILGVGLYGSFGIVGSTLAICLAIYLLAAVAWRCSPKGRHVLSIDKEKISIPSILSWNMKKVPWSNISKIEARRSGVYVHYRKPTGLNYGINIPPIGNDPTVLAKFLTQQSESNLKIPNSTIEYEVEQLESCGM